jgi:fumarate reductase subunit D
MGKYYKQSGHYRTYKDSGKTISVNGGPGSDVNGWWLFGGLLVGIAAMYPLSLILLGVLFGVFILTLDKVNNRILTSAMISSIIYAVVMIIYMAFKG